MADLEHVRWIRRPELRRPHVIAAFTGWNDAADAASMALKTLIERLGAAPLAEIDPEEFTDFATIRPHVRLSDASNRHIVWPTVSMWSVSSNDQDLILVLGPEPALRWKLFCKQIIGVAQTYQAQSLISLGALLADVPHRHPTQVLGTAVDQDMIDAHDLQRSRYEGPTGIVGVLNDSAQRAGLSSASLWAAVPAYAAQLPSPKAAAALIDRLAEIVGCDAPTAVLDEQYDEYEAAIDQIIENDPSMASYLERLENMDDEDDYEEDEYSYDESDDDDDMTPSEPSSDIVGGPITEESLDSEAFLEEVEQFLRSQHDD
ncbi:MAG: PAC2 family protein [Acidimicrobiia bacterium]|jgi:proteasome assembly chaperone (PAC2) family protein|nr:PAC2 family protein [Actinomycetota bacterium]NDE59011.1 PAC2 family protein [Acidimicrobiia bacterium]NDA76592.1 PAC2 family protein [Actinomycetota bacterium]NDD96292.1 PAC2 family protein [Actinomycetota bacterium]NDE79470.1 PAC2 family protein [Actinomycetota bacterium]